MSSESFFFKIRPYRAGILACLHVSSLVLLTVGYFTPVWVILDLPYIERHYGYNSYENTWIRDHWCHSVGIIYHQCHGEIVAFVKRDFNYGPVLNIAFILTTSGIVTVYVISGLILAAILVPLHRSEVYMSFLSIAVSILYPAAAGLVLAASIYVEASFPGWTGYSVILCTVSSGILFLAYVLLFVNEYLYTTDRQQRLKYKTISGKVISDMNKNHLPDRNNHIWHYTGEPGKYTPTEDFGYQTLVNKPNTKDQ